MSSDNALVSVIEMAIDSKIEKMSKRGKSQTVSATYVGRDSQGVEWVRLNGSTTNTPIRGSYSEAKEGDAVSVQIGNGYAFIVNNLSNPSSGVNKIIKINQSINKVTNELHNNYAHIKDGAIDNAVISYANITDLESNYAHITEGEIDNAIIDQANVNNLEANYAHISDGIIDNAKIGYAQVKDLEANYAHIENGVIDNAQIGYANVRDLDAHYAHIEDGVIDNATIDQANVNNLEAYYAHITEGIIDNAKIDQADVNDLDAHYAHIDNGVIDNATIGYADVDDLEAHYAQIDLANIENGTIKTAMIDDAQITSAKILNGTIQNADIANGTIENAKIKDGTIQTAKIGDAQITNAKIASAAVGTANIQQAAITNALIANEAVGNAQIIGVSANKLTAGTIDASNINVANLRADSLIVNRLNGQPVFGGYTAVNSNAPGYSDMNPSAQGWYEISNGQMVATSDTEVDPDKAYYTTSTSVALYDQAYIDGLETNLNQRIDGSIQTYNGTVVPTLANWPYTDWYDTTTSPVTDTRQEHIGDLYYVVNSESEADGYCYRFAYDQTSHSYMWILIKDSDVTAALSRIDDLESFESTTNTWITETDQGITTIRQNVTTFSGIATDAAETASAASTAASNAVQTANDVPIVTLSSTNGTVFKRNTGISTTIIATIFTPGGRIDNITELRRRFGNGAYLEWGWRDVVTDAYHALISTDERIGNDGFSLTVSPEDIDTQAVITCTLNY